MLNFLRRKTPKPEPVAPFKIGEVVKLIKLEDIEILFRFDTIVLSYEYSGKAYWFATGTALAFFPDKTLEHHEDPIADHEGRVNSFALHYAKSDKTWVRVLRRNMDGIFTGEGYVCNLQIEAVRGS